MTALYGRGGRCATALLRQAGAQSRRAAALGLIRAEADIRLMSAMGGKRTLGSCRKSWKADVRLTFRSSAGDPLQPCWIPSHVTALCALVNHSHRLSIGYLLISAAALTATTSLSAAADSKPLEDPLRFFEGRTEMVSVVKIIMKKPYQSRTIGNGRILPDGSLALVQRVNDEGKPPKERRWKIRRVAAGRLSGTMSEAVGPVMIQEINGRYRFRFKMKGNLAVEQWLSPLTGGRAAQSTSTVRKLGIRVATSRGTIRKL